ncbi:low molecular weight phosphatase family protein [Pareuzebyella sediminis]|uniref:protein-tyrosine-phosphatase n=1 Tax=Pareuzebyella sediminis TaxID=2607998 RepID=UPI0011F07968|nr:protein-tyrosine-phosphatase [Pareuzebyella sediminis]
MVYPKLDRLISTLAEATLSAPRKKVLQPLVEFIQKKVDQQEEIRLNFICTHNSRRSHLAQVWAQTMAHHFSVHNCFCYSGGTEATALFPTVVETLQQSGFEISMLSNTNNPIYAIKYSGNSSPIIGFSKKWDAFFNPRLAFAAIMTCSQADEGCPFITGAEKRIPITYDDPKAFDHTPQQAAKYRERSLQIALEMHYVFNQIKLK